MEHLSDGELISYINGNDGEKFDTIVEEHIFSCDECLERYMRTIETSEALNNTNPSPGFSDKVMVEIKKQYSRKKVKNWRNNTPEILVYYTVAACITLIFTFNGVFHDISTGISEVTSKIADSPVRIERSASSGWSERLLADTSMLIDKLRPKE